MQLKVLFVLSIFAVIISCAPATTQYFFDSKPSTTTDSIPEISSADILESANIDAQELSLDERIAQAEYLCSILKFHDADSILREVLAVIEDANENDTTSISTDQYVETVIHVYTMMMPQEYIPEEIMMLQFKNQMLHSLDSLSCSPGDSAIISKLISRKDIKFDVPMVWNDRVKKALNYYISWKPGSISKWLQRASIYLPRMKKMFSDSGLPEDLAYLPLIESGFNVQAYSRAHASGIWQFISSTGKVYGLRHNYWIDERRDPLKSTGSAISYLKKLYADFGNWHLALAAYNCGEGGVARAITKSGTADYWQLSLPTETKNYVPTYLAALTLAKNADLFNFSYSAADTFSYDTVTINDCIDLRYIAEGININYDSLRVLNPQILHWCTPPDVTNVNLYLPNGSAQAFKDFYVQIPDDKKVKWYAYKVRQGDNLRSVARRFKVSVDAIQQLNRIKNSRITAGKVLFIPIPANSTDIEKFDSLSVVENIDNVASPRKKASSSVNQSQKIRYVIKKGDTISEIASLFDVSIDDIKDWNNLSHSSIRAGQVLTIYSQQERRTGTGTSYRVQEGDTPYSIAKKFNTTVDALVEMNNLDKNSPVIKKDEILKINSPKSNAAVSNTSIRYVVEPGDNLFRIAQNFSVSLDELLKENGLSENSKIFAGDIIHVPRRNNKSNKHLDNIVYYEVKQGDNLWNIAASFGIPVKSLYTANHLKSDSVLMPGDIIKVVKAGGL